MISSADILTYPALSEKYRPAFSPYDTDLPGSGEPSDSCGEGIALFCLDCEKSFYVRSSCMMRHCPHCYQKWAAKQGKEAAWRFWTGINYIYQGYRGIRYLHYFVSLVPKGESYDELRDKAREISSKHGFVGGLLIPHCHRLDDENSRQPDGTIHFHGIGIAPGKISPGGDDGDTIFRVIKDPGSDGKPTYRGFRYFSQVKECCQYLLSHAAIIEGKHSLTWWGLLSYNKLNNGTLKEFCPDGYDFISTPMKSKCPFCGSRNNEPCFELDLVPVLCRVHSYDTSMRWQMLEVHPPPVEVCPLPYNGPKKTKESDYISLDSYFEVC